MGRLVYFFLLRLLRWVAADLRRWRAQEQKEGVWEVSFSHPHRWGDPNGTLSGFLASNDQRINDLRPLALHGSSFDAKR